MGDVSTAAWVLAPLVVVLAALLGRCAYRGRRERSRLGARLRERERALAHAEQALADRERRLRQAQRLAGLSTWEWELSADRERWGPEAIRLLSLVPLEGQGRTESSLRHVVPEDQPRVREAVASALGAGKPLDLQFRVTRADGSVRCLNARAELVRAAGGKPARLLGTVLDITDYKEKEEALRRLATRDGLTGALSRHHFFTLAERELDRARRYPAPLAVMMIDLDHLKPINDAFGHGAGDGILRQVVAAAARSLRQTDLLGRYGGDEFCALLPSTGAAEAADIAERIRRAVAEVRLPVSGPERFAGTTVSIGVAVLETGDETIEAVLRRADKALYRAKQAGRDRVVAG
jgi:diguanylate cyclase (GGDEF)-like protein/PAS domain S-box-containing protein